MTHCKVQLPPNTVNLRNALEGSAAEHDGKNSKDRVMTFLKKTGVAAVPGMAFYHDQAGESLARFCFSKEDIILNQACRKIERLK